MKTSDPDAGPIASYDNGEGFGFGISAEDGTMYFARCSADLQEKMVTTQPGPGVGHAICRGDIDDNGTMWAVWDWHNVWYHYVFKLDPPSDW